MQNKNINVFACPHPFSTRRYDRKVEAGKNLEEILISADLKPLLVSGADVRLFVGDRLIGRQHWTTFYPQAGESIAVRVLPTGGDSGKNVLRAVLFIAVVALSYYAGPAGAGLLSLTEGSIGFGIASSAISIGVGIAGALAVNALVPPVLPSTAAAAGAIAFGQSSSITGIRNRANHYGPVQRLFGTHKIYPTLAAAPYSENFGADSYLRMLFCIGKGDYDLTDMKIGETALTSFSDYTVDDGDKDAIADLYPNDVYEDPLSVELEYATGWYQQTTQTATEEITVDVTLTQGLFRVDEDNGKIKSLATGYEVQYSVKDAGSWNHFDGSPFSLSARIQHRHVIGFRKSGLAANQYDVRIKKTVVDYDSENLKSDSTYSVNTSFWTVLRSIKYVPPVDLAGCHLVALRIKASGQLNGVIDQFNCIATSKLSAWTGSAWATPAATRNPAWAFAEVLRGNSNKRPIADASIDGDGLKDWADACTTKDFYFDFVLDRKSTVFETLAIIAAAGRAARGVVDNKYTVIRDVTQSTPIQHFSPRNSWGFKGRKIFQDIPHGFKARFINSASNYQQDEIIVYDDGYNSGNATVFETLDFPGITTADHIWQMVRYHIAVARLRPETYEINTDVEHLVCTRGDLVRLTHDVLLVGLGAARIKEISGNDVTLDDFVPMEGGKTYGAQIRKADGTMLNTTITLDAGEQYTVTLASVTGIAVKDLLFFGETGSISSDCLLTKIEPGPDLSARLTLVDYAPDVLTADSGTIPDYDPNITHPPEINKVPPTPNIESISLLSWSGPIGEANIKELYAVIDFSIRIETEIAAAYFQTQYREIDTEGGTFYGAWIYAPDVPDEAHQVRVPVSDGVTYDFRVRAVSQYGVTSPWDTESDYTVTYEPTIPNDITGLALIQGGSTWAGLDCEIKWTAPGDPWRVFKYQINVYKTSGFVLLRTEYVDVGQLFYSYGFVKNEEDNAGSPVGGLTIRIWAISKHDEPSATFDVLIVTHAAPASVTSLAGTAWSGGVNFSWDANTDAAFSHFEYRVKVGAALNGEAWLRTQNPNILRMLTSAEKDTYGADATIYIEVKAVNRFATASGVSSTNLSAGSLNIQPTDIDDFAITASKIFTKIPIITGDTWTDDTPDTDSITWNAHSLIFNGVAYSISGDDSNKKYIYWDKNDVPTTYHGSDTHPVLDDEGFIIATNIDGKHDLAWNAIANQVIGSAYIQSAAIQNAHISDLNADKINAGYLAAARIEAASILIAKLDSGITDRLFSDSTRKANIEAWRHASDATLIDGGDIYANSIQIGKLPEDFPDAFANPILDPTFSLTNAVDDYRFWTIDTDHSTWSLSYGEDGPGVKIDCDGTANYLYPLNGNGGAQDWLYTPATINDKILIQIRIFKSSAFDGSVTAGINCYQGNAARTFINHVGADIEPSASNVWQTITVEVSPSDDKTAFIILRLSVTGGSTGYIQVDSVNVKIETSANFRHASDATLIDGGKIYSNSVLLAGLESNITARMFTDGTRKANIEAWRHSADATLIDGGDIYANSILISKLPSTFPEAYGNVVGDPTIALTKKIVDAGGSDAAYYSLTGNWSYVASAGESGPGLAFQSDGSTDFNQFYNGAGAAKHIPMSKNEKVSVQVRGIKDNDFDGSIRIAIWEFDENPTYIIAQTADIPLTTSWATHTFQLTPTSSDCHFILLVLYGMGGAPPHGFIKIDSVHAQIEPAANFRHASDYTKIDGGEIHASSSIAIGPAKTWQSDGIQLDYNSGNPRFYCGDGSNNYLQFDGTNLELSTSKADALVIKSGGDIKLEAGGDIKLHSATGGATAQIQFFGDARTYTFNMDYDTDYLQLLSDTDEEGLFTIGSAVKSFSTVKIYTSTQFVVDNGTGKSIQLGTNGLWITHTSGIIMEGPIFIKERPSSYSDKSGHGQLWVKDTVPCQLWYTDDTGSEWRIALV